MLTPDDRLFQEQFLRLVINVNRQKADEGLRPRLKNFTERRLGVYNRSFLGRTIAGLSEIVLAPLMPSYSKALIGEVTARYFQRHPPEAACIVSSLKGLPAFIEAASGDTESLILADLVELCLQLWDLEHGIDDLPQRSAVGLSCPARFLGSRGDHDLYCHWENLYDSGGGPQSQEDGRGILLLKSRVNGIETVPVSRDLVPIARSLAEGEGLIESIQKLSEDEADSLSESQLADFVRLIFPA